MVGKKSCPIVPKKGTTSKSRRKLEEIILLRHSQRNNLKRKVGVLPQVKIEVVDCNLPEPEANYEAWVEANGRPAPEFPGFQSQQEQATAENMPVPVLEPAGSVDSIRALNREQPPAAEEAQAVGFVLGVEPCGTTNANEQKPFIKEENRERLQSNLHEQKLLMKEIEEDAGRLTTKKTKLAHLRAEAESIRKWFM